MSEIGNVVKDGRVLVVSFKYTPKRYMAIKQISGARYISSKKAWSVPLSSLSALESSRMLNNQVLSYDFDLEEVYQEIEDGTGIKNEARRAIRKNPFEVSDELIQQAEPDIIFKKAPHGTGVAVISATSKQKPLKILNTFGKQRESVFMLSAHQSTELVKELKRQGVLFAVHEEIGALLKDSSNERRKLLDGDTLSTGDALQRTLLVPYVDFDSSFVIQSAHHAKLKHLLPMVRSEVLRKERSENLSSKDIFLVLYQALEKNVELYITQRAFDALKIIHLESLEEGFEDFNALHPLVSNLSIIVREKKVHLKSAPHLSSPLLQSLFHSRQVNSSSSFTRSRRVIEDENRKSLSIERVHRNKDFRSMSDFDVALKNTQLKLTLFPHQRVAVGWLLENERAFLGDDMGLGKTVSVLAAADEKISKKEASLLCVIAPASLVPNWIREAKKWLPERVFASLPQGKAERIKFLNELVRYGGSHLHGIVLSYEALRLEYVTGYIKEFLSLRPSLLCLDESQRIKNHQSKAFQSMMQVAPTCGVRWMLSGTPIPRSISDIWTQIRILDDGERFGKSYYKWLGSVAELGNEWSPYAVKSFYPEAVEKTIIKVQELLLRRRKEEVLNLPAKIFHTRDIELHGEQKKRYDEIKDELMVRINALDGDSFYKEIDSLLEQYLRAVQVASNPRLVDETFKGEPAKFLELDDIISEIVEERGEKIVVWTNYLGNVHELTERYKRLGVKGFSGEVNPKEREKFIRDFQDPEGDTKILIAVPAAGGVGITLTQAQTAVYLDKTWNGEHWIQSVDRIHRIGQTGTVNIISLCASKIDTLISINLRRKESTLKKLLDSEGVLSVEDFGPTKEELIEAVR